MQKKRILRPDRGRSEALGAAKQICCLVALGHFAYVRTAEPYASTVSVFSKENNNDKKKLKNNNFVNLASLLSGVEEGPDIPCR